MTNLDVLAIAGTEFRDAVRWYRSQSPPIARRFALTVKAAMAAIHESPTAYPR